MRGINIKNFTPGSEVGAAVGSAVGADVGAKAGALVVVEVCEYLQQRVVGRRRSPGGERVTPRVRDRVHAQESYENADQGSARSAEDRRGSRVRPYSTQLAGSYDQRFVSVVVADGAGDAVGEGGAQPYRAGGVGGRTVVRAAA